MQPYQSYDFVYNSSSKNYSNDKEDDLPSTNYIPDDFLSSSSSSSSSKYKDDYLPKHREQVNMVSEGFVFIGAKVKATLLQDRFTENSI